MDKMIGYIFNSLQNSERAIDGICKNLTRQNKFNKRVVIFAVATTVYLAVADGHRKWQDEKIDKLTKEVKALKEIEEIREMKGE